MMLTTQVPPQIDEFWTSKQRAGHSLHEVSYRACYKPQLPAFLSNGSARWMMLFMTRLWDVEPH